MEISFKGNIEEYKEFLNSEIKKFSTKLENNSNSGEHEYVDLGLPSGTLWATMNIGASKPEEYGDYFALGETKPKKTYDRKTYKYIYNWKPYKCSDYLYDKMIKYCNDSDYGLVDNKIILEPEDDAATVNWGEKWRMPTYAEQTELRNNCYWVYTSNYHNTGVAGYIVYKAKSDSDKGAKINIDNTASSDYSLSDAHIFLPCAGYRFSSSLGNAGSWGYYWSSSVLESYCYYARYLYFFSSSVNSGNYGRYYGRSVRAVYNKK